jgi:hypothetical protein
MGRGTLSFLLASILWVHCGLYAKAEVLRAVASSQASGSQKPTLKEQVVQIPAGSQVEVRLLNKERLRGRLGEVSDETITVQIAQADRIDTRKVAFGDVKSVRVIGNESKKRGILIGVAAAFGTLLVLALTIGHLGRED